jgi:hypothetical protein
MGMLCIANEEYSKGVSLLKEIAGKVACVWFEPACWALRNVYAEGVPGISKDKDTAMYWSQGIKNSNGLSYSIPDMPLYIPAFPLSSSDKSDIIDTAEQAIVFVERRM